jgi:hypothetical protein
MSLDILEKNTNVRDSPVLPHMAIEKIVLKHFKSLHCKKLVLIQLMLMLKDAKILTKTNK